MKSLFLVGLVGLFSLTSVLDAEACHRRRCGGRHHRHCHSYCYTQPCYTNGGCQVYGGGYQNGAMYHNGGYGGAYQGGAYQGGYVDPNMPAGAGAGVGVGGAGVEVDAGASARGTGGANVRVNP